MRYIWIPLLSLITIYSGYLSYKNNITNNNKYSILLYVIGLLPIWTVVSKFSNNLTLDALIYDSTVALLYILSIVYFSGKILTPLNWIGIGLVITGILLNKE